MKIILESIKDIQEFKSIIGGCGQNNTLETPKEVPKEVETPKGVPKEVEAPKEVEVPKEVGTPKEEVQKVTKADVQKICKEKIKAGKTDEVKKIIESYGAKNISNIDEKDYASVVAEVEVL